MKNYERRFVVFGIALILMTVVILVLSTCSIPFENIEGKQKPDASAIPVPQNVNAQTITASRIGLAWQDTPIAVSYSVYRSTAENGEYTVIATVRESSYIDNSVSANSEYFYYVTLSVNNMGESGKSEIVQADTKPPMPSASITTAIISATEITVTWQLVAAAESYKVYRSSAQDSGYTAITPLPITTTSYSDETVSINNVYYYRVTSINYLGEGEKSVYAKGFVKGPDAPQGLTAVPASESSIKLEWDAVDGVTGYKVYKSTTGSGGAYTEQASVTETAWTDTGLIANTSYYYKIEAINGIGVTMSDFVEGKIIPPPAPLNVRATAASNTSIKLEWDVVDGVTGYKVYKSITDPGDTYTEQANVTGTSWTDTGLTADTIYYYKVAAVNGMGTGGLSTIASGRTMGTMGAPTVIAGMDQLTVSWAAVAGAYEYEVYCDTSSAPTTLYTTTSGTTATITGLINNTLYYVRLKAKNTTGTTAYGATASGTPSASAGLYDNVLDTVHKIGNQNLASALTYLSTPTNVQSGHEYFIVLGVDEFVSSRTLSYSGKTVGITLIGLGVERTIVPSASGTLFDIGTGVTLTLDDKITLSGRNLNTSSIISISGTLVMKDGSKITGNTNTSSYGGGVYVNGGAFIMQGGIINGNTNNSSSYRAGGGVYINSGSFTMEGGIISENTASLSTSIYGNGGGVYVGGGSFIMQGGTISGNIASSSLADDGGGVLVNGGLFSMEGGIISGNTASSSYGGGGVRVYNGTFIMKGGTINGNTASYYGGGVYVSGGNFSKNPGIDGSNSGIIYGSEASGNDADGVPLKNTATNSSAAVYYSGSPVKKRNTTAGQTDYINTSTGLGLSASGEAPF